MKKMLAKAVALSLVLGGVGFVANDAFAATTDQLEKQIQQEASYRYIGDLDLQTNIDKEAKHAKMLTLGKNINANKLPKNKVIAKKLTAN